MAGAGKRTKGTYQPPVNRVTIPREQASPIRDQAIPGNNSATRADYLRNNSRQSSFEAEKPSATKTRLLSYSRDEIDTRRAYDAYRGTSFTPERRAEQVKTEYADEMKSVDDEFSKYATPENREELAADLERYKEGYKKRLNASLEAKSRTMSAMIAGPAKFPTRRNQKKMDMADRRTTELLEYRDKTKNRLRRKYKPNANAPVSSDDKDAIGKLQAKIDRARQTQETMKAANKIVRKKGLSDEQKITALAKIDGLSRESAKELLKPDFVGRQGFAGYQLQNNNANIKRMEQRITALKREEERRKQTPARDMDVKKGVRLTENTSNNRLQIFFDEKPSPEMRSTLKSKGFRWSPREKAWQRQLNDNARAAAAEVLKEDE